MPPSSMRSIVEPLDEVFDATWRPYLEGLTETLATGWDGAPLASRVGATAEPRHERHSDRDDPQEAEGGVRETELRTTIRLAVHFQTWQLLTDSGLDSEAAARVAARMVAGVSRPAPPPADG